MAHVATRRYAAQLLSLRHTNVLKCVGCGSRQKEYNVDFLLTGFDQAANIRRYHFEGIAPDRARIEFMVRADLILLRKYAIPLQELPLLCRHVLETHARDRARTFTFAETDMLGYANDRTAAKDAAEQKRKAHRQPPSPRLGQAWRSPNNSLGKLS
jgi:hypothetical protein